MPNFVDRIEGFGCGDNLVVERSVGAIPNGLSIVQSWMFVRKNFSDSYADAKVQKYITTTSSGQGQITDDGTGDNSGVVQFTLLGADTTDLYDPYWFEIRIKTSDGNIYTSNLGYIRGIRGGSMAAIDFTEPITGEADS